MRGTRRKGRSRRQQTPPTVDRCVARSALRRSRARPVIAGVAGVGALWWLCFTTTPVDATSVSQGSLGNHGLSVKRSSLHWSDPRILARCGLVSGPQVAFPSESPATPTGVGAIVWASEPISCGPSSPPSASWTVSVAALGAAGHATLATTQPLGKRFGGDLAAVGASFGRIAITAAATTHGSPESANVVIQGRAIDPSRWPSMMVESDPATALTRAYLGDVAIAATAPGPAIAVRVERYFDRDFGQARRVPIAAGPVTALTATMDYRADVLLAWQQNGAIYARMLRVSGAADSTQRVGPSGPHPQLQAVVSDNGHGMIAWSSTEIQKRATARTRIYLDLSQSGVRFGQPRQIASFADPQQVGHMPGSLAIERLSTENVMLAWTADEHGHYVVRAAPAVFAASRPTARLSDPHAQAILVDLAPGPTGEAIALWRSAPRLAGGTLDARHVELWATRTSIRPPAHVVLRRPAMIAPAGPNFAPTVAVDPATDQAVAAWFTGTAPRRIEYAVATGAAGYRPRLKAATAPPPAAGAHWLRIALAVAGLVGVAILFAATGRRRRMA